jgi:hypothetical protein
MARKYRRLLYHHRIIFFTKCNIDPEARPIHALSKYAKKNIPS